MDLPLAQYYINRDPYFSVDFQSKITILVSFESSRTTPSKTRNLVKIEHNFNFA